MDFAGPFIVAAVPARKPKLLKAYMCVFVCMGIKAVHLELVGDLSSASFLAALKRFSSRRGLPQALYSDGGKNFIAAKDELRKVMSVLTSNEFNKDVSTYCSETGIKFHFNPPLSPHHGGLSEAGVKSAKFYLIEDQHLSLEEMATVLCQVEGVLNSRPLVPMSTDPSDYSALAPAHFLIGSPTYSVPAVDLTSLKPTSLKRWEVTQQVIQQFWKRFNLEYLQVLQSRPKWLKNQPNIEPGVFVLVKESDASFSINAWNLARISQVFPGPDGLWKYGLHLDLFFDVPSLKSLPSRLTKL